MKFPKNGLVFVEHTQVKRDGKKDLNFVRLADPTTYENEQFMLDGDLTFDFQQGQIVDTVLDVKGKFSSIKIYPISK